MDAQQELSPALVVLALLLALAVIGGPIWWALSQKTQPPRNAIMAPPPPTFSMDPARGMAGPPAAGGRYGR
jgi:hypothetical protein